MSRADAAGPVSDSNWLRQDAVIEAFEQAWRSDTRPQLDDFLPPHTDASRSQLLAELVKLDLDYRWTHGERPGIELYLARYPELSESCSAVLGLIAFESRVRRDHGMVMSAAAWCERFPHLATEIVAMSHDSEYCDESLGDIFAPTHVRVPGDSPAPGTALLRTEPPNGQSTGLAGLPASQVGRIGRYELREAVGRGGFATVYRAWDAELTRDVAIKLPREEFGGQQHLMERVLREARSAAQLRHPAIVPIHEVGTHGGTMFIVYEFVPGPTLAKLLHETRPSARQAATWVARIAEALDYAHECGVVHRDVKPANIMMNHDGQPMIADFGLARHVDSDATLTLEGDILGTPAYMSPEQAAGRGHEADARSDVYGIGAVLYELLCRRPPFDGSGISVLHRVIHEEPAAPRAVRPNVPVDLETICLKAMAKEPTRRYASAGELSADLKRYLNHEPIHARPTGPIGLVTRWCRRKPALATTLTAAAAAIFIITVFSFSRVVSERNRARELSANLAFDRAVGMCEQGDAARGLLWFARSLELAPADAKQLQWAIRMNLSSWSSEVCRLQVAFENRGEPRAVTFSSDGAVVLCQVREGEKVRRLRATNWRVADGLPIALPNPDTVASSALSPDGQLLLTGHHDGAVRLWDATTLETAGEPLFQGSDPVFHVAFSGDGTRFLAVSDAIRVWETATRERTRFEFPAWKPGRFAFSRDGRRVIGPAADSNIVHVWDTISGDAVATFELPNPPRSVAASPDGRTVITVNESDVAQLWDVDSGEAIRDPIRQVSSAKFSRAGELFVTSGGDNAARLWNTRTGEQIGAVLHHHGVVQSVDFSPDGSTILTGSLDRTARLWRTATGEPLAAPLEHSDRVYAVAFAPDGRSILTGEKHGTIRIWNLSHSRPAGPTIGHRGRVADAAFTPDGRSIVTASGDEPWPAKTSSVRRWDRSAANHGSPVSHAAQVGSIAISPDGSMIATGCWDGTIRFWDAASGDPIGDPIRQAGPVCEIAFNRDGSQFLTGNLADHFAKVWDMASRSPLARLPHNDAVRDSRFSHDGKRIATSSYDGTVRLWDATTLEPIGVPLNHRGAVGALAFSPDDRLLVAGNDANYAQIWDVTTQRPFGPRLEHAGTVRAASFSPDGRLVVTGSLDATARLWEPTTSKPIGVPMRHQGAIEAATFSPDGKTILTAGWDGTARFWPVPELVPGTAESIARWVQSVTGLELDTTGGIHPLDVPTWRSRSRAFGDLGNSSRRP